MKVVILPISNIRALHDNDPPQFAKREQKLPLAVLDPSSARTTVCRVAEVQRRIPLL